ncbi:MAG: hypothetical protein A3I12_00130 [Gammaproteobacteria bacterium RIFCSPLOWO2_02_FULL_38_11]|nr:MAG: hypothetical protein A3B69_01650 [Gammaproteobacteria bacterium RIFCSPHIGHO2_02_FULL_38_33]OGT24682.1 MAG: hypothetical protein A2W47_02770 [Gammaproteobacteria bacterium RIFCSPHIGHO2_12_38_15]OGT69340.1 MAG: hypothetical protein A3I12_00130 [Gammaproteobacteria bacterium RIFCSPLOWO2_02_FULL_38_11]OGT76612.1 MAG: hypothetical protein A3G71_02370 [Gammaproteobacteria bacterium RIFCSPLOWO2_12_FULL_38_14]
MRALALYAMKGRKQAFFLATFFALIPFLGWIGSALMGLVTLRTGPREGFLLLLGLTFAGLVYLSFGAISFNYLIYDTLANTLPTFLGALFLRHFSWNKLIEALTYLGLSVVILAHLFFPDLITTWTNKLISLLHYFNESTSTEVAHHTTQTLALTLAQYATGIQTAAATLAALFNLIIARYMQASLYHPGGLKKELQKIHIPTQLGYLLILMSLLALFKIKITQDLLPVILLPFACAGLSLFHDFISKRNSAWAWLILFYTLLCLALPYLCVVLIIVGFIDTFYELRTHLKVKGLS